MFVIYKFFNEWIIAPFVDRGLYMFIYLLALILSVGCTFSVTGAACILPLFIMICGMLLAFIIEHAIGASSGVFWGGLVSAFAIHRLTVIIMSNGGYNLLAILGVVIFALIPIIVLITVSGIDDTYAHLLSLSLSSSLLLIAALSPVKKDGLDGIRDLFSKGFYNYFNSTDSSFFETGMLLCFCLAVVSTIVEILIKIMRKK